MTRTLIRRRHGRERDRLLEGGRADRRGDDRRRPGARIHAARLRRRGERRHGDRRRRQVRDPGRRRRAHPHGDAVRRHVRLATPSRPAPAPRRGAGRRPSSTSSCSTRTSASSTSTTLGTRRPTATVRSTTASTRSCPTSSRSRSPRWTSCIAEGVTSFKLFMAYKGVFLSDDGQILRAFQKGASNGALMMMHAENGSVIDVLVEQAVAAGNTAPLYHGLTRPWQTEEEATHRAIMIADLTGAPALHRARLRQAGRRADRRGPGPRQQRVRRDLPAVPVPLTRGAARRARASRGRSGCAPRRSAAARRATRTTCGRRCARTTCRWCRRTTARSA